MGTQPPSPAPAGPGAAPPPPGNRKAAALKYAALQLPGKLVLLLVLLMMRDWLGWSLALIGGLVAVWLLIDVAIFPWVWRSYDPTAKGTLHTMVGLRGQARDRLAPEGYALVRGELWRARSETGPIEAGAELQVVDQQGLLLRVRGLSAAATATAAATTAAADGDAGTDA